MVEGGKSRVQSYTSNPGVGVGTLRRMSGRLTSSLTGTDFRGMRESIFNVKMKRDGAEIEIGTMTPYSSVHEQGYHGSYTVPGHTRRITQAFGRRIAPRDVDVRTHTRVANIPARPYLMPAVEKEYDYLQRWLGDNIGRVVEEFI
jgi:phage gpG-like protein